MLEFLSIGDGALVPGRPTYGPSHLPEYRAADSCQPSVPPRGPCSRSFWSVPADRWGRCRCPVARSSARCRRMRAVHDTRARRRFGWRGHDLTFSSRLTKQSALATHQFRVESSDRATPMGGFQNGNGELSGRGDPAQTATGASGTAQDVETQALYWRPVVRDVGASRWRVTEK